MVYRMTKIISPSCMQLKIVRIHLLLMICVLGFFFMNKVSSDYSHNSLFLDRHQQVPSSTNQLLLADMVKIATNGDLRILIVQTITSIILSSNPGFNKTDEPMIVGSVPLMVLEPTVMADFSNNSSAFHLINRSPSISMSNLQEDWPYSSQLLLSLQS